MADVDAPQKRSAKAPEENELTNAIVDAAPDALMVVDCDGRIVRVNAMTVSMFGYSSAELLGRSVESLIPASLRSEHQEQRRAFLHSPRRRPMAEGRDLRARRKDGAELSVQISLSPIRVADVPLVVVAVRETPEFTRNERASAERSRSMLRELEAILETIPDPVVIRIAGSYAYVNSAFVRALSYDSADALLAKPVLETVHHEDRELVRRSIEVEAEGLRSVIAEIRMLSRDGASVPLEFAPPARIIYHGQPAFLVVAHDMRDRKRLEAALGARDRMVTVGTLAAGIGHEINNPLAFITMNLEFLAEEIRAVSDEQSKRRFVAALSAVTEAQQGAERIRKIVRGLHTFARGEREQATELDLHSVLETSFNLTQNELRHHVRLVKEFHPVPHVHADESRLAQVFINLLLNAAHAMRDRPVEQNTITVSTRALGSDSAIVEIRDNGPGMTTDVLAHIFEPFFTTKPIGEGTGLGLAIASDIVSSLGGKVTCESNPGAGATFRIELPALRHSLPAPLQIPQAEEKPCRRGRVLVVDDDPVVASSLARVLRPEHDVECASDGREALAALGCDRTYDVILCDVMMPRMTAADLYGRVAREYPDMASRFVFMTGATSRLRAHAFLDELPNPVLAKPFGVPDLLALMRRFVRDHDTVARTAADTSLAGA